MDIIGIDFLEVDKCFGAYENILAISDHFTRYTQIYATKNELAKTAVSKIYNDFILRFGNPKALEYLDCISPHITQ